MLTSCLACGSLTLPPAHYSISRGKNQPAIYLGICLMPSQNLRARICPHFVTHTNIYLLPPGNAQITKDKDAFPSAMISLWVAIFNPALWIKVHITEIILRQFWQSVHPSLLPIVNFLDPSKRHSHIPQPTRISELVLDKTQQKKKPLLRPPKLLFPGPKQSPWKYQNSSQKTGGYDDRVEPAVPASRGLVRVPNCHECQLGLQYP